MPLQEQLKRLTNRARRELDGLSWVERRSRARYAETRRSNRHQLPRLLGRSREIVSKLRREGFYVAPLSEFGLDGNDQLLGNLNHLAGRLEAEPPPEPDKVFTVHATDPQLLEFPFIYQFGIQSGLMDLIEAYFGMTMAYHGPYVRRDFRRRSIRRSRLWHRDLEDHRMIKLVVLVREVNESNGPLEILPAQASRSIARQHRYRCGWIQNRKLTQAIERASPHVITGAPGTAVLVDPSRVFHRGRPIAGEEDRYTVFYDYTTASPRRPYYCKSSLGKDAISALMPQLSSRQRRSVNWRSIEESRGDTGQESDQQGSFRFFFPS